MKKHTLFQFFLLSVTSLFFVLSHSYGQETLRVAFHTEHTESSDAKKIYEAAEAAGIIIKGVRFPWQRQLITSFCNFMNCIAETAEKNLPLRTLGSAEMTESLFLSKREDFYITNSKLRVFTATVNNKIQYCLALINNYENGDSGVRVSGCGDQGVEPNLVYLFVKYLPYDNFYYE